jgi:protein gp37
MPWCRRTIGATPSRTCLADRRRFAPARRRTPACPFFSVAGAVRVSRGSDAQGPRTVDGAADGLASGDLLKAQCARCIHRDAVGRRPRRSRDAVQHLFGFMISFKNQFQAVIAGQNPMGKNSKIEWTNHTFNPWWGCVRVSAACKHCYAEAWAKRVGSKVWGAKAERRLFGNKHWLEPIKWNAEAKQNGERRRVFCASMADIFEKRKELDSWRERLWVLINDTPDLDWLLLTKRPQHVSSMIPWGDKWPKSVWLGTTIENQEWADKRLPIFADIPAAVRFISAEPLLGPIDLEPWLVDRL